MTREGGFPVPEEAVEKLRAQAGGAGGQAPPPTPPVPPVPPDWDDDWEEGVAGWRGSRPQEEPPEDLEEPLPDADPRGEEASGHWARLGHRAHEELREKIMPWLRAGESTIYRAPTGHGKTAMHIAGAGMRQGVSLVVSPLSTLNQQLAEKMTGAGLAGFFLPGHPGEGAPAHKWQAYEEAHQAFYKHLGVRWSEKSGGWVINEEEPGVLQPVREKTERRRYRTNPDNPQILESYEEEGPVTGFRWDPEAPPAVAVMSYEKLANLPKTRLGQLMTSLGKHGLVPFLGMDEPSTVFEAGRPMARYIQESLEEMGLGDVVKGATGGDITEQQIDQLERIFGFTQAERITKKPHPQVTWRAFEKSTTRSTQEITEALKYTGDKPAIVFPANIARHEAVMKAIGGGAFQFHKDPSRAMDPQRLKFAEEKLKASGPEVEAGRAGILRGEVGVLSSAAGIGIDRPEVANVVTENPYTMRTLEQQPGRLRDPFGPWADEQRAVSLVWDASTYQERIRSVSKSQHEMQSPTFIPRMYDYLRSMESSFDKNWITASGQMDTALQKKLKEMDLYQYSASDIRALMSEPDIGLMDIGPVGEGEDRYFGWRFKDRGTIEQLTQRVEGTQVKSAVSPTELMSVPERIKQDLEVREKELGVMLDVMKLTRNLPTSEERGELLRTFFGEWKGEQGKGGLSGIEAGRRFADVSVPKAIAERYTDAVVEATKVMEESIGTGKSKVAAEKEYTKTIGEINNFMIGSEKIQTFAKETAGQWIAGGGTPLQARAGMEIQKQIAQQAIAGGGALPAWGGAQGGGPEGVMGRIARHPMSGAIYGLWMARRMWQMIGAGVLDEAARAGAVDYFAPTAVGMAGAQYSTVEAGTASRLGLSQYYMGRGALEQWGGFMELPYALSGGGGGLPRIMSGMQFAGGLAMATGGAGTGAIISGSIMEGMAKAGTGGALAAKLGPLMMSGGQAAIIAGLVGAAVLGVGTLAMEGFNVISPLEEDRSWSSLWKSQLRKAGHVFKAGPDWGDETEWRWKTFVSPTDAREVAERYGYEYTPEMQDYLFGAGETEEVKRVRQEEKEIIRAIGGQVGQYVPALTMFRRELPSMEDTEREALTLEFFKKGLELGFTGEEYARLYETTIRQLGVVPGEEENLGILKQLARHIQSPEELFRFQGRAQRVQQFAGQLSPYMSSSAASQFIQKHGLTSPTEIAATTGLFSLAERYYGWDMSEVAVPAEPTGIKYLERYQEDVVRDVYEERIIDPIDRFGEKLGVAAGSMIESTLQNFYEGMFPGSKEAQAINLNLEETPSRYKTERVKTGEEVVKEWKVREKELYTPEKTYGDILEDLKKELTAITAQNALPIIAAAMEYGYQEPELNALMMSIKESFVTGGFTPRQEQLAVQMMSGDLSAISYATHREPQMLEALGMDVAAHRFQDYAGRPIHATSGRDWFGMMVGQADLGRRGALSYAGMGDAPDPIAALMDKWGVSDVGMMEAFWDMGTYGAQDYARKRSYELSMASVGLQMQQIEAQRMHLWGGGPWTGTPAPGSMWYMEDQSRLMQHQATMRGFDFQIARSDITNVFAQQQEALSLQRMQTTHDFQRWTQGFDYQGMLLQQQWSRQDWQYQDQMRGMQFGWQMEDIDEAIRYSTGRERRRLVRQRDRMATTHSLEGEQIEKTRDRQEEVWSREEERFTKQVEYSENLMTLDRRQFDLQKSQRETLFSMDRDDLQRRIKEYTEQYELQTQIIEKQRQYQADQLDFQEKAAGIQAAQIQVQYDLELITRGASRGLESVTGELAEIAKYGGPIVFMLEAMKNIFEAAGMLDRTALREFTLMIEAVNRMRRAQTGAQKSEFDLEDLGVTWP